MNDSISPGFRLSFLGATATVTGSKYLIEADGRRILVDCGLFQGYKPLRLRNWAPFPVDPRSIDAVILTHAHLDHSGYLPRLVRDGFRGRVWCTPATRELCAILLPDSGHLLEEDAEYANRRGYSKHQPALPLYTEADAQRCLQQLHPVEIGTPFAPLRRVSAVLRTQGHILGAASVRLEHEGVNITFSGDIGRPEDPIMKAPHPVEASDWIVTESTYGNRTHPTVDLDVELAAVVRRVAKRGGVLVIPAFAVGRAQLLLYQIARLKARGDVPHIPVFLNSPMAVDATSLYHRFRAEHRLTETQCEQMCRAATFVNSVEESKALNERHGPMIIISASGMATGGRVVHHLKAFAPDPRNAILLAGYQAGGTRGAALAAGASTIRIHGQDVPVRAEVIALGSASAHADANEILSWLGTAPRPPRGVFVTHGEPDAADALCGRIERELGWSAIVPEYRDVVDLTSATLTESATRGLPEGTGAPIHVA
ncbi:MBL fold metallo-hydrolase RNA specificity domain-containing protein [Tahibacter amnicola]|uniref:MBL fold metallo-hydrolase n=1 Tax=Tahibacter amnicola TaxID=2976241 RepID=A0ABY6B8F6_9GAMM|nr:MBL fold metallo-hydrolase [Tahibacter amnicola]UXI66062.1 MBL fold metallo-hydrolase [Tahibacter amnicola]